MKIGARVPQELEADEFARRIRAIEKAGFNAIWMYETYFYEESFSRAGYIAAITERVKIGTGIINPYSRHPGLTAMAAATVDRLSRGRLIMVMGIGGRTWLEENLGYQQRHRNDLAEAIAVMKRMLAGESVTQRAQSFSIKNAQLGEKPIRSEFPIYMAAEREKMLEMASSVADGVFTCLRPPTGYVRWARKIIDRNRTKTGLIELGTEYPLRITDEPRKELQALKPTLAYYLSLPDFGEIYLQHSGHDTNILKPVRDALKTPELMAKGRNPMDAFKTGDMVEAAKHVPDELVEDSSIVGDPGRCRDRIAELESAGLTFVNLAFQPTFDQTLSKIKEILPEEDSAE